MEQSVTDNNSLTDATSIADCKCEAGQFLCTIEAECNNLHRCMRCPPGALCDLEGETLQTLQAKGNFWRATNRTIVFHPCPSVGACSSGRISSTTDDQCLPGHTGLRCELCDTENGYALKKPQNLCVPCARNEGRNSVIAATGVLAVLALFLVALVKCKIVQRCRATDKVAITADGFKGRTGRLTQAKLPTLMSEECYEVMLESGTRQTFKGKHIKLRIIDFNKEYQVWGIIAVHKSI